MHYPLIVIGAGAGGLVLAIGAAKAGKKVLLVEEGSYGGDCTNFGCIPSKTLIASTHLSFEAAMKRARALVKEIREEEEPEALAQCGVETCTGHATFVDEKTIEVNGEAFTFDKLILATGSRPFIPNIEGISETPYLTNETVFDLEERPDSLLVIGGGPIGCELSQAFQRLGVQVTLIQKEPHLLMREDSKAQKVIEETFVKEGINLKLNCNPTRIKIVDEKIELTCEGETFTASKVLIAAGRKPSVSMNVEQAEIDYTDRGIVVDRYGRTSNRRVLAVGDCTGLAPFTHMAEYNARQMLWNLFVPRLFWKKWHDIHDTPRVTFTDPEVASMGQLPKDSTIYTLPFSKLDRARTTGRTEGFVKVATKKWSSKILGATIVAPRAGEMLMELSTAKFAKVPLRKLAQVIHPYPTYSLAIRKVADMWLTETLIPEAKRWIGKK